MADDFGGWFAQQLTNPVGATVAINQCDGGGLYSRITPSDATAVAPGSGVGWSYKTPSGTRVKSVGFQLEGWTTVWSSMATQFVLLADGATVKNFDAAGGSTLLPTQTVFAGNLNALGVQALLRCSPSGASCQTSYNLGWSSMRDISVTLIDESPPEVRGTVAGSLVGDSVLSGNESVAFAAVDSGGGVREVQLWSGAVVIDRAAVATGACQPTEGSEGSWKFSTARPCPVSAQVNASFDTRKVADGAHALSVRLLDAAGNATTVHLSDRVVANAPPVNSAPPSFARADLAASPLIAEALKSDRGTWSGPNLTWDYQWQRCNSQGESCDPIADATALSYTPTRADEGHRLRVAVTGRNVVAVTTYSAVTGVVRSAPLAATASDGVRGALNGKPEGGEPCPNDAMRISMAGRGTVRLRYRSTARLTVRLRCAADGRPVSAASLRALTRVPGRAAPSASLLTTDVDGKAIVRLDGRTSRTINLSYRLHTQDEFARASQTIKVLVRGGLSLKVSQKGSIAIFRGRLSGGHIPTRGVAVQLQWRDGKRWRPVATLKSHRDGSFRYKYRFSGRARGFRYRFRAVVNPGQTDYPFLPARSPVRVAGL